MLLNKTQKALVGVAIAQTPQDFSIIRDPDYAAVLCQKQMPSGALAWLAGGLGAVFLLGYAAALAFMARSNSRMSDGELRDVATYLPADGETVLLCLHDPESYYFLAASDVRLCKYNGDLSAFGPLGAFLPWFFWRYPFVHPEHLDAIVAEHGVRYVLLNKRGRERLVTQSHMDYDLTGFELLHENDGFGLYRTGAAAGGAASR